MSGETIKLIEERIEELYNSLMEKPLQVLGIFNDFFGEDKVDMQGYMDLDMFKSWISKEPLATYSNKIIANMNNGDWELYKSDSILKLPEDIVEQAINSLQNDTIKSFIGSQKFGDIFILVHFPHVRVTNENDRFVDINHLWAKVKVLCNGTLNGKFSLNRSEYTLLQFRSGYMHSHVNLIPTSCFTSFQNPCTGTGPINNTICSLNRDYDEDMWNLFCLELSKYVTVESIAGTPYHYLEKLGTNTMEVESGIFFAYTSPAYFSNALTVDKLKEFIKYFIGKKKLKFNYVNGSYSIGMSLPEYIILISNEFISWYNTMFNEGKVTATFDRLKTEGLLKECIIDNGKIYYETSRIDINNCLSYIGKKICTFKGKEVTLNITDVAEIRNENKNVIFNVRTALCILTKILKVLNYRYGRETDTTEGNQLSTETRYL